MAGSLWTTFVPVYIPGVKITNAKGWPANKKNCKPGPAVLSGKQYPLIYFNSKLSINLVVKFPS